jgi:hypothetical protein
MIPLSFPPVGKTDEHAYWLIQGMRASEGVCGAGDFLKSFSSGGSIITSLVVEVLYTIAGSFHGTEDGGL